MIFGFRYADTLEAMRYIVGTTGLQVLVCSWEQAILHALNILDGDNKPGSDGKPPPNATKITAVILMDDEVATPPPEPAAPAAAAAATDDSSGGGEDEKKAPAAEADEKSVAAAAAVASVAAEEKKRIREAAGAAAAKEAVDRKHLLSELARRGIKVYTFAEIERRGQTQRYPPVYTEPTDLNTVIFTSGSTGLPKGVMITEAIQYSEYTETVKSYGDYMASHPVMLEFFPFAWATGRDDFRMNALMGGSFAIYERPMQYLLEELRTVRPSAVQGVPSIYNVIYAEAVRLLRIKQEKMKKARAMRAAYEAKLAETLAALESDLPPQSTPADADKTTDSDDKSKTAEAEASSSEQQPVGKPELNRQKSETRRPLSPSLPGDDPTGTGAGDANGSAGDTKSSPDAVVVLPEEQSGSGSGGGDTKTELTAPAAAAAAAAAAEEEEEKALPLEAAKATTSATADASNPYLKSLFPQKKNTNNNNKATSGGGSGSGSGTGSLNKQSRTQTKMAETLKRNIHAHTDEEYEIMRSFANDLIGDRARFLMTGGAMTSPTVLDFLRNVFPHCRVYDGYGTTEAGGISLDYKLEKKSGVQIKLVDVVEMGYLSTDKPYPRGEICVKTKRMAAGYFNNPEATAKQFIDGWFHTGTYHHHHTTPRHQYTYSSPYTYT